MGRFAAALILIALSGGGQANPAERDWEIFKAQFQDYFQKNKSKFTNIVEVVSTQKPVDVRAGRDGMIVKWTDQSSWDPAPNDIEGRLKEDFFALQLLSIKTSERGVFFLFRTPALGFDKATILPAFLFSFGVDSGLEECTEASVIREEHGRCQLPLGEGQWYVEMDWAHI